MHTIFWMENFKGNKYIWKPGKDGRKILIRISEKKFFLMD